jgi:hypothetical protein
VASKVRNESFWFEAELLVKTKKGVDKTTKRSGTLYASGPLDALDQLYDKAKDGWNGIVLSAKVCTVDENGEIVATTKSSRLAPPEDDKTSHSVTQFNVYDFASHFGGHRTFPVLSLKRYES